MPHLWKQLGIATNWPVLAAVGVLSAVGVVSIWAHAPLDGRKQLVFLAGGVVLIFALQALNYQRVGRYAWPFYFLSLLLLLYTVCPGVPKSGFLGVPDDKGQRNWINFGPIHLQPSELMKVAFCMVMARYLRFRSNYRTLTGLLAPFALAFVPLLVILKQPDLGTALVFIPTLFAMLFVAGAKGRHLLAIMALGMAMAPVLWLCGDKDGAPDLPVLRHLPTFVRQYQRQRIRVMFTDDPALQATFGFQQKRALEAMGSGGFSGKGIGQIPAGHHVPEAHNDMIFSLVGEQFGFIGSAVVLGAYLVLFAAGIEIAAATREPFGRLMALGIVSILAGQAFLNLLVTVRLMPVTGITLPLVSYGGSSMLASCIAVGLLLNVGQNRPLVMARDSFEF